MIGALPRYTLRLVFISIACLALLQLPVLAAPAPADGPNLLVNGGMEGKYVMQCSQRGGAPWLAVPCGDPIDFGITFLWATAQVPVGWTAWWQPPNENRNDPNFYNSYPNLCYKEDAPAGCAAWHNPEFRDTAGGPQTPPYRKVAGDNSQKYFTFYSLHDAGLYQTVGGLTPGQRVRFSVYMQAWSTQTNDPFTSEGQPTMGLRVGIDPTGGNNPWGGTVVWSPVKEAFDHWELFTVEAVARSNRVTVFTRSRPYFAIQHNDVYVDEASLVVVGAGGNTTTPGNVTATPRAGGTPRATQTLAPAPFAVGDSVFVGNTGGLRLRLRSTPSRQTGTVTIVPIGTRLVLREGPRIAEATIWWKVYDDQSGKAGWVAQRFLLASSPTTPRLTATIRATGAPTATVRPRATGTPAPSATPRATLTPLLTATPRTPITAAPDEYIVQRGDSLVSIAKKFGLLSADLIALNPQLQPPRYYVYPGQILRIRP
ncbi:MAG TPA: LysM peptidoglycan-binding domain-containing protein [Anaerolineae bacterium]|nr:LysM peptidoglycan-binding domain-containing protein [Anaerolineae bacterium]